MGNGSSSAHHDILEPDRDAVAERLREMEVPRRVLLKALRIGHVSGHFVDASYPPTFQGLVVWAETSAVLRRELSRRGWIMNNNDNIARVISPGGELAIVAISGNKYTGLRNKHEQLTTRRPRGPAGLRIIWRNLQLELALDEEVSSWRNPFVEKKSRTWFLLYYQYGDVVRSELSYATGIESGELKDWKERLILPDIDLSDGFSPPRTPYAPAVAPVDVPISRRK